MDIIKLVFTYEVIYTVTMLMAVVVLFLILHADASEHQLTLTKIALSIVLETAGYLIKIKTKDESGLNIGYYLIYLGGTLNYYFIFNSYAEFCNFKLPKWLKTCLGLFTMGLSIVMTTFTTNHLVYKTRTIGYVNGMVIDTFEAGPAMYVYRFQFVAYAIAMLMITGISFRHASKRRRIQALQMLMVPFFPLGFYLYDLRTHTRYSLVPIGIIVAIYLLLFLVYYEKIYDLKDTVKEEALNHMTAAIVAVGTDGTYQGSNKVAKELFPKLSSLAMNDYMSDEVFGDLLSLRDRNGCEIQYGQNTYEASIYDIGRKKGIVGQIIWLSDITAHKEFVDLLRNYQVELEKIVDEKTSQIVQIQSKIMLSMADIIENRDGNTGGHVKRTSEVVKILTKKMTSDNYPELSEKTAKYIIDTAALHDIGKLAIDDRILRKPGRLDEAEFSEMKTHAKKGGDMILKILDGLEDMEIVNLTEHIAHSHHEKWDGSGYPDGLKGNEIPIEARVMAIADVYDALVSKRCYKEPMSFDEAYSIMESSFGSHFDPSLKKYFDASRAEIESYYAQA